MISDVDDSGDGEIDFDEFMVMMTAKMGEKDSRDDLIKAFRVFDSDETGAKQQHAASPNCRYCDRRCFIQESLPSGQGAGRKHDRCARPRHAYAHLH